MTHASCQHRIYALTCEDYENLLARSGGRCEVCLREPNGDSASQLCIDHDPKQNSRYVRGLLCRTCNSRLGHMERGERPATDAEAAYLADAWFLTNPPPPPEPPDFFDETPVRLTVAITTTRGLIARLDNQVSRRERGAVLGKLLAWYAREPGARLPRRT